MAEGDASHADATRESPEPSTSEESADESSEESSEESPEPAPDESDESPPRRRSRPGRLLRRSTTALVLLVLALALASYAFDLGPLTGLAGPSPISEPDKVPPPEGLTLPETAAAAQVAPRTEPQVAGADAVRRALAGLLRDKRLGPQVAVDVDQLGDGTPLFHQGAHLVTPASTMKLLTTTAALEALGPDHRFTTSVVAGDTSKQIVLVGGGDPLLEAGPATEPGETYPARADLQTLATSTARSLRDLGHTKVHLRYDASLFSGPAVNRHWPAHYVPDGVVSPISALWVDEGRLSPDSMARAADPAAEAATVFADELAKHGITVVGKPKPGTAPVQATRLGAVQSAPLAQIVEHIIEVSDNEGAEVLARQVAVAEGVRASFAGGTRAVRSVLRSIGVDTSEDTFYDGSGLSRQDRLTPATLLAVLQAAATPAHAELRSVLTSLPVAGFTGSLTYRFQDASRAGLGVVRAKTGTLTGVSGLAGVVTTRDGAVLDFVAVANGFKPKYTGFVRDRLDQIGSALAHCTCAAPEAATSSSAPASGASSSARASGTPAPAAGVSQPAAASSAS